MYRNRLERALRRLGLGSNEDRLLLLLPILYVLRSKGPLGPEETERIAVIARDELGLGHHGIQVARRWATEPLPDSVLHEALQLLGRVSRAPDVPDIDGYDVAWLISEGEAMAQQAAAHDRRSWSMDPEQRAALLHVAQMLGVDHGQPWGELLVELGEASTPVDQPLRPEPLRGGIAPSRDWQRPSRFRPSYDSVRDRQARRRRGLAVGPLRRLRAAIDGETPGPSTNRRPVS